MLGQFAKNVWGSNSSRGFRLGAWAVALGTFGAWFAYDQQHIKDRYPVPTPSPREKKA